VRPSPVARAVVLRVRRGAQGQVDGACAARTFNISRASLSPWPTDEAPPVHGVRRRAVIRDDSLDLQLGLNATTLVEAAVHTPPPFPDP
jgi:hypothetical protein